MAERRMFSKSIVLSDAFLDMPLSARCLYFTLGMLADDDGFVNSPKSVMRQVGASIDDLNILLIRKFVLSFDSGVIVIKHWRMNNYLRSDRYTETKYKDEKQQLGTDENGAYTFGMVESIPGESIAEELPPPAPPPPATSTKDKHQYGEFKNVLLTDEELAKLKAKFPSDWSERIEELSMGLALKGYVYRSHYLAILKWAKNNQDKPCRQNSKPAKNRKSANSSLDTEAYERAVENAIPLYERKDG